jgi:hypothetical protein
MHLERGHKNMAGNDKELKALLGGGSKVNGWHKAAALAIVLGLAWVLSWEWGLFLVLIAFGGWTAYSWSKEKGNIVDSFRDFVLYTALLATALGAPMQTIAGGFRGFGPVIVDSVKARWAGAHVEVTPAPAPPPEAAPPAPPAAPAAPPAVAPPAPR